MPRGDDLPPDLRPIADMHALEWMPYNWPFALKAISHSLRHGRATTSSQTPGSSTSVAFTPSKVRLGAVLPDVHAMPAHDVALPENAGTALPRDDVMARLESIVREVRPDLESCSSETDLRTDLKMDPLEYCEFVLAIEEKWGIDIPDDDADNNSWYYTPGMPFEPKISTLGAWHHYIMSARRKLDSPS